MVQFIVNWKESFSNIYNLLRPLSFEIIVLMTIVRYG